MTGSNCSRRPAPGMDRSSRSTSQASSCHGLKNGVVLQLDIDPAHVRVVSPFVGGAFGSKGSVTPRTALVAIAARRLGRPVKLGTTRDQSFTVATYRAETRHSVRQDDRANPAGIKGLGELGNVGTAAAIANAVHHATGQRIRNLPIRIDKLRA